MGKRTILAIILSVGVLFIYSSIIPRFYPPENKEVIAEKPETALSLPSPVTILSQPLQQQEVIREYITLENNVLKVSLANPGGYIAKIWLKKYAASLFAEDVFFTPEQSGYQFIVQQTPQQATLIFKNAQKQTTKQFSLSNNSYIIELEQTEIALTGEDNISHVPIFLTAKINLGDNQDNRFVELVALRTGKAERKNLLGIKSGVVFNAGLSWLGMRDRYFALIVKPAKDAKEMFVQAEAKLYKVGFNILPEEKSSRFILYAGPQSSEELRKAEAGFDNILYFGVFDAISQILLSVLKAAFNLAHNWGVAILLFSVGIFLLLYPLTLKQMRSMREMQILQPKIKELQERHKKDPQKLNKEMMLLYREHKVNPLGGCLPLLLQMPVFFALYQALMRFVELRGAQFLWIKDLSQPDRFFVFSSGKSVNLLPILMVISTFIQQKLSAATMSSGVSKEQQKIMGLMMPIMFGFIFYNMPAALVLYWLVSGILNNVSQGLTMRAKNV